MILLSLVAVIQAMLRKLLPCRVVQQRAGEFFFLAFLGALDQIIWDQGDGVRPRVELSQRGPVLSYEIKCVVERIR